MDYKFHFKVDKDLPRLAWIAKIDRKSDIIDVIHGSSVECRDDYMVEGVWDGEFEEGNFHRSENFFGSGIRIENGIVYFTITSSPIDRLLFCEYKETYLFSNSLILLLAYTGAILDINHDYERESLAVCISRNQYSRKFTVIHPEIKNFFQVFHENIIFTKEGISFEYRYKKKGIKSYAQCLELLNDILHKIRINYESDKRKIAFAPFSMLSEGYDSTAVSSLVKQHGVKTVFIANLLGGTIPSLKNDDEVASATIIAQKLGYTIKNVDNKRSNISEDELYFLATTYPKHHSGAWSELGLHPMTQYIENNCTAAVVFSGHHGDSVWDAHISKRALEEIRVPSRPFGFCSEMRLKSGFINIPLPGILATDIKDIAEITHSHDMEPWRLHNSYDRPVPRRIAEESGVDRHLFGMEKKFIATKYTLPINHKLRSAFFKYLRAEHHLHAIAIYKKHLLNLLSRSRLMSGLLKRIIPISGKTESNLLGKDFDLYFLMCIWATHELSRRTAHILKKHVRIITPTVQKP